MAVAAEAKRSGDSEVGQRQEVYLQQRFKAWEAERHDPTIGNVTRQANGICKYYRGLCK